MTLRCACLVATLMLRVSVAGQDRNRKMAERAVHDWPAGRVSTLKHPEMWSYEQGVLLDGMRREWEETRDPRYLAYIRATVDSHLSAAGEIEGYKLRDHSLDSIESAKSLLLLFRETHGDRYARAAIFVREQLRQQPRTASGGFWHKAAFPNQMWLDGSYMAAPFLAEYAAVFHHPEDFDEAAQQLLLVDAHMRDASTGLLYHGWDESREQAWADKSTGLSQAFWARGIGWYAMAIVDTLDWIPPQSPWRSQLLAALQRTMTAVLCHQDASTGLWWEVVDKPAKPGNFVETSASCMFTYVLAKSVRKGYLPATSLPAATRGWQGIQQHLVTEHDGIITLHGTVRTAGLGGQPYRTGDFDYYIHEGVIDDDAKGIGAFLMAGSEMERLSSRSHAH